ncbi:MAG TPA: DUF4388 domain-containing protein [Minicystis sp.]|nr:DUF4388 domain-containing protein [Minicystis sp.]
MDDERLELVRVDATGAAHPVGKTASQRLRARQGAFRLMPAPSHLIVMRYVGEDGKRDDEDGPVFRLAGEITAPGALCDIVALVGHAGWKGELVVFDGATARSIFFDHGNVIGAQSSVEGERLGEVLYRYGALTQEQVATASKAVTPEVRFGEATVKLGFLSREKLFQLMSRQTEEIVYAVLLVGDGMFYFLETFDEKRLAARQNLSVNGLLMEGVRRMDETRYFRDRIPSDQHVPERVPNRAPPEPELEKVFEAVDGARSVAEICRVVEQGEFEVTQALFQLVQSGLVVVHAPRPTGPAAIVALFNEAMGLLFRELDQIGKGGEVREQLASFATGAGIYDALFQKAGPGDDGTVAPERIIENVAVLAGPDQAEAMLAQWLYEYVSFAMFVAEPYLRAAADGAKPDARATISDAGSVVQRKIAELIGPLAPKH